jgi:hypothetical protein
VLVKKRIWKIEKQKVVLFMLFTCYLNRGWMNHGVKMDLEGNAIHQIAHNIKFMMMNSS